MIQGMTGFGNKAAEIAPFGKVSVELRSSNHKFLETVFHLPEGLSALEERARKEIEPVIKRGRVTCVVTITGTQAPTVSINKALLKNYLLALKGIGKQYKISDEINIDTLIHLPGVLSLEEAGSPKANIWPRLKILLNEALGDLARMRRKEGEALHSVLKKRERQLNHGLNFIKMRFKAASKEKLKSLPTDEERAAFLKDADIAEEMERLAFHAGSFRAKLSKHGPVGKELDFIAQEMQREANTLGAKTFDAAISGRVVQIKSQIEKIREQVQNIE